MIGDDKAGIEEDMDFLNQIDQGYIGISKPQIQVIPDPYEEYTGWVRGYLTKEARKEDLSMEEFVDKYDISPDPRDWAGYKSGWDHGNYK